MAIQVPVGRGASGARLRGAGRELAVAAGLSLAAGACGYVAVRSLLLATAVIGVAVVAWLFTRLHVAAVLLGFSVPFVQDVTGGRAGLNVSLADLLLLLLFAALVARALVTRRGTEFAALAPLRWPLTAYLAVMAFVLAAHLGLSSSIKTFQRLELFAFPLVVGVAVALWGWERWVLRAYVVAATVLAAAWPLGGIPGLAWQKNPAGQFMANAILVLVGVPAVRRRMLACIPVLMLGLLWTQSRGAILALGAGLIILVLVQPGGVRGSRRKYLLALVPLTLLAYGAFQLLPQSAQQRNTDFQVGDQNAAARSLQYRVQYQAEAWRIVHAYPWTGVGVGQYLYGTTGPLHPSTSDPHEVLLLQAAEGGYPLAAGFVLLVLGSATVTVRRARGVTTGPVALAVLLGTVGHGFVDVYWVRGTPVLGWLLVGVALGAIARARGREPSIDLRAAEPVAAEVAR